MNYDCFERSWDDVVDTGLEGRPPNHSPAFKYRDSTQPKESPSVLRVPSFLEKPETNDDSGARRKSSALPFIKGPLCRDWIVRASRLRKPALTVALALYFKAGVKKDDFIRGRRAESQSIRCDRSMKKAFGITPSQMSRGLRSLQDAGLIRIVKGGAGRCPVVVIINIQVQRRSSRDSVF